MKANGRNKDNLTGDIDDDARPVAWREGPGASWFCGDGNCDPGEDACNCPEDCFTPLVEICDDGLDNDCDGLIDCDDPDCGGDPFCPTQMCMNGGNNWATVPEGCKDFDTGLVWSLRTVNWTWFDAKQYAADLTEGGFTDWRLPTKVELETAFSRMAADQLPNANASWSSTRQGNKAWFVNLTDGSSQLVLRGSFVPFFCVRESP